MNYLLVCFFHCNSIENDRHNIKIEIGLLIKLILLTRGKAGEQKNIGSIKSLLKLRADMCMIHWAFQNKVFQETLLFFFMNSQVIDAIYAAFARKIKQDFMP